MNTDFISLHNHTHNSLLDGYSKSNEYIERALELGQRGLGNTDHGNLFGIFSFLNETKKAGIIGVPGCEFYVAPINPEGAKRLEPVFYGAGGKKENNDVSSNGAYLHLTVWAYNSVGLHNLFMLSTLSNDSSRFYKKPRIDFEMLSQYSEGLIVATGCPSSEISTRFLLGQDKEAYNYANQLKEVFGERLFVEIMDHSMSIDLEKRLIPKQLELSKKMGIPLLATNDCHYAREHDSVPHEEMLCIQSGSRMDEPSYDDGGSRFAFQGNQYYLKTADEMLSLFPHESYPNAVKNTMLVAEMASDLSLEFNPHLKPKPFIPPEFNSEVDYYKYLIQKGFKERYGHAPREVQEEAVRRNKQEFNVIYSSDFVGYMLVVRDYLEWAKENYSTRDELNNILALSIGVGRGSVGGSVHAFELGISEIDPIKHDLIFERFLSAGRGATYRITYDDGSTEEIIVSNKKKVLNNSDDIHTKYIHQLQIGDTIIEE